MKKEVKIVSLSKETVVGMGFVGDHSVGSAVLDAAGKSSRELERELCQRFISQVHQKRIHGIDVPKMDKKTKWTIRWYDYNDVAKTHVVKENVMERVCGKPKVYSIEKREDGSLKVNKIEGKLYDEDEVKVALCQMALED